MKNIDKTKINRLQELAPLNLTKTQYRPYVGNFPNKKNKQNLLLMGPTQNIIFDIPQIQQTRQPIQYSSVQKLRIKITKYFEQKSMKLKQQWIFYTKKSQIVANENTAWTEVETFLLKIIHDLFTELKNQLDLNLQLQKSRQVDIDSDFYHRSVDNSKMEDKFSRSYNVGKIDHSINQNSNILRPIKAKGVGRSQYKAISTYSNIGIEQKINDNEIINHQAVKISRLQKQLQLYKQRMKSIEQSNRQKLNTIQKKIQIQLKAKYSQTMQEKMKYQSQVQSKKFYNDILGQQFNSLKKKYAKLEIDYQTIKNQFQMTKNDKNKMQGLFQYRELWLMQYEQILQLKHQILNLKSEKESQMNKNKGLKQKLKELSKNFNYNYNVSIENEKDKQDLNTVLKDFRDWLKFFAVPRVSKGMMNNNTFFPQMNIGQPRDNFSVLLPKDDNTNYKLLRPNFFIYFQAYEGIILAQRKFPQRTIMPPSFFLTIRAILDAMFLHFNFTSDFKQWLSFPQFVISFIEKFQISQQTKKPFARKTPCQSQQKINFLLNVFNIEAANTWECEIFRSFILEQFTLDQLYFYLECRDNLLRGSQLNNNFGSSDSILYIKVEIAEEVIKDKLRNYQRQMIQKIKKFINSKKKVKNNRQFVDINFVLKLLLEVYSIQKVKSQRFFHHNFKSKSSSAKLSYTEYSAFMSKNFDFLTKGDIAKLYRQIYTLGVSHITYKTIHYICSMKGLFIPLLRTKLCSKVQPIIDSKYPKMFEDILFLQLQNSLNNIVTGVQQYGVEEIVNSNVTINKLLHDCQKLRINRSNFSLRLLHESQKVLKIKSILAWKNQKCLVYQELTKDEIRQRLVHLLSMIHQSDEDVASLRKLRENRDKAMLKLTKNFKIRIQQSLAQFKVIDKKQYQIKISKVQSTNKKEEAQQESEKDIGHQQDIKKTKIQ